MREWCRSDIERILDSKNLLPLIEKKICKIDSERGDYYINGFEYGLFTTKQICKRLSVALHSMGFIGRDMITPFIMYLASARGFEDNYIELVQIKWSKNVILGLLKRPDARQLLACRNNINGYEFALSNKQLSKEIGLLIFEEQVKISEVIRFSIFKSSPPDNIKQLFCF